MNNRSQLKARYSSVAEAARVMAHAKVVNREDKMMIILKALYDEYLIGRTAGDTSILNLTNKRTMGEQ